MLKKARDYLLIGMGLCLAACGTSNDSINRITAIPENQTRATATATPLTPSSTPPAVSGFAALAEAAARVTPIAATPTALSNSLPAGNAQQIAAATDAAMRPVPRTLINFTEAEQPVPITFDEFYDGYSIREGLIMSDKLTSLDGQRVVMEGYMAPPLKPELDFFVLTRIRLAFCPFCSTAADWPDDIALVYLDGTVIAATLNPVRISGRLEVGASVDQETGMVSLVRIYVDNLEILD